MVARQAAKLENRAHAVNALFLGPLICAAALLSFAHGANDVANAIGPLAAIVDAVTTGGVSARVGIPGWVLFVGAAGISLGLFLFGPKLIRTVGAQITRMNPVRAFCVALSAAITVIVASGLGLPVSSTHIAVGGIFGVGFYREYSAARRTRPIRFAPAWLRVPGRPAEHEWQAMDEARRRRHRRLVRRRHILNIVAAWVVSLLAGHVLERWLLHAECINLVSMYYRFAALWYVDGSLARAEISRCIQAAVAHVARTANLLQRVFLTARHLRVAHRAKARAAAKAPRGRVGAPPVGLLASD